MSSDNAHILQNPQTLVEVKNLKMHFPIRKGVARRVIGQVRAVDGVSFTIDKGETLGLVGESGCGKTTVGRCMVRAYSPTDGQILFRESEQRNENTGKLRTRINHRNESSTGRGDIVDFAHLSPEELRVYRREIRMIFQEIGRAHV